MSEHRPERRQGGLATAQAATYRWLRAGRGALHGVRAAIYAPEHRWRAVALQAGVFWLITRFVLLGLTYYALVFRPHIPVEQVIPSRLLYAAWLHGDASSYLAVAAHGYEAPHLSAFLPLYPLLARVGAIFAGGSVAAGALLVSQLAALAAFIALALLAADLRPGTSPARALAVFVAYPFAFMLAAATNDALFVALVAGVLLLARLGRWRWAAVCAFLAGLTALPALALVIPMVWMYGQRRQWWRAEGARRAPLRHTLAGIAEGTRRTPLRNERADIPVCPTVWRAPLEMAMVALAVPAALAVYALYCWVRFGDALAFVGAQSAALGHGIFDVRPFFALTWSALTGTLTPPQAQTLVGAALVVTMCAAIIVAARRGDLPMADTLYLLVLLYLSLAAARPAQPQPLAGSGSVLLAALPLFVWVARECERRSWLDLLVLGGGFMLQALFAVYFLNGGVLRP